jgi:hypothetical protein
MKPFVVASAIVFIAVLSWVAPAEAVPITYTESATASGSLGGVAFSNALVTIRLTSDTANVMPFVPVPSILLNVGTATVTIAGLGDATFNNPNGYAASAVPPPFAVNIFPAFVIAQFDNAAQDSFTHILGLEDPALQEYDLASAFGPLTGTGIPVAGSEKFGTTRGDLVLTSGSETVRFTAAIPEPSSMSLFGAGVLALLTALRRRKHS